MNGELKKLRSLIARNIKLYFKDKMVFLLSLMTPLILVFLFLAFLKSVYQDVLLNIIPDVFTIDSSLVDAFTGGWLFSSIVSVSCVTVAFCSNMMVADKISRAYNDIEISSIRKTTLRLSYPISNFITTLIICVIAVVISLIYLAIVGFYLSATDVLFILLVTMLSVLFGCLLSSIVGLFISSQGALSGVCTLISSFYGFINGAFMPLAQFSSGMQHLISFNPGIYGTVLLRQYYMNGVLDKMSETLPSDVISTIRESFDGTFFFFGTEVSSSIMYAILVGVIVLLLAVYLLLSRYKTSKNK